MANNLIFGIFIGGLVFWIAEWIYDVYLWRRQQTNNAPLLARASNAESQALSLKSDLDVHKSKLNAFDIQVSDLHSRLSLAQTLVTEHEHKFASANEELEKLKLKLAHMVEKKVADAAQAEVGSLKTQLQTANQNLNTLKPSAEKAASLESQLVSLKASFEGSVQKPELDAANAEIASLKARVLSYSEQTEAFIQSKKRIVFLETELEAAKTKLSGDLEAAKAKSQALEAEVTQLKADGVLLMTQRLAPALERIKFLETDQGKTSDASDSADLKAKLAALELEYSELHAKISDFETETAKTFAPGESGLNERISMLESELTSAKGMANHSAADMAGLKSQLRGAQEEIAALKASAGSNKDSDMARLKAELAELRLSPKAPSERDRLEQIDGIGDVYEHHLNAAGIWTFAQLAQMSVESILKLIQPEAWQNVEPDQWILEAAERAKAKALS